MRDRSVRDWMLIGLIGAVVFAAFLAPAYVVNRQHEDAERIIMRIEANAERRLEDAIRVNVLTITCILSIEQEDRTRANMTECIRAGFAEAPGVAPPDVPEDDADG